MKRARKLYLPYVAWPEEDRILSAKRRSRRGRICSTTVDLQPISRKGHACSYSTATENFSLSSGLVILFAHPYSPPNASTARSSKTTSNGNQQPAEA